MPVHKRMSMKKGSTCDFEPHCNIRRLGGNNAHHVRHRIAFHDGKGEGRLLKTQGSCVGWNFWFRNPLNVQTAGGGSLRTSVVHSFNLEGKEWTSVSDRGTQLRYCKRVSVELSSRSSSWRSLKVNCKTMCPRELYQTILTANLNEQTRVENRFWLPDRQIHIYFHTHTQICFFHNPLKKYFCDIVTNNPGPTAVQPQPKRKYASLWYLCPK